MQYLDLRTFPPKCLSFFYNVSAKMAKLNKMATTSYLKTILEIRTTFGCQSLYFINHNSQACKLQIPRITMHRNHEIS